MTAILEEMCRPSEIHDLTTATNLAKEAMQEMILCTLSKDGFFDIALFHGGTCLRILHGLDRFSEDLDFTLLAENRDFDFTPYSEGIIRAFHDIGVNVHNSPRPPRGELQVFSDKIKVNLREILRACGFADKVVRAAHSQENCVVKIDVDICTPGYTRDEVVHKSAPLEYSVRTESLPVLFAGKTSAVLCRHWGKRVKGRDLYDFRWYVEHDVPIDLECLRMRIGKKCAQDVWEEGDTIEDALCRRFDTLDWDSAREDLENFVESSEKIGQWGPEPFKELAGRIRILGEGNNN